jgi:hypothetical protein
MSADPRYRAQHRRDTEYRFTRDGHCLASASAEGEPYLAPLSFDCDGEALLMATPSDSLTGSNLAATWAVRPALGHTRDVSMIEARSRSSRSTHCCSSGLTGSPRRPASTRVSWPRRTAGSASPRRVQAWREVSELPDRELMRDGRWLA